MSGDWGRALLPQEQEEAPTLLSRASARMGSAADGGCACNSRATRGAAGTREGLCEHWESSRIPCCCCSYLGAADRERELQTPAYSAGPRYRPQKGNPAIVVSSCPFLEPRPSCCASRHCSAGSDPKGDHKSADSCSVARPEPGAFRELNGHSVGQTNFGKSYATASAI